MVYVSSWRNNEVRNEIETNIMSISKIISQSPIIKDNLGNPEKQFLIQNFVKDILDSSEDIEIIVVVDMNNIRYAHPDQNKIGLSFIGGDQIRVLKDGASYISEAEGTLGKQVRAFSPVFNGEDQVGFVMVSKRTENVKAQLDKAIKYIVYAIILGLSVGSLLSLMLSNNIKKSLLGLEPDEISRLYLQKESMLEALHEGIIAVDKSGYVTMINNSALNMLNLSEKDIINKNIGEHFDYFGLNDVLKTGKSEFYVDRVINNQNVIVNIVPIRNEEEVIGVLATFNDRTKFKSMAEELTGFKQIVDSLRANSHEFMNKLHTILGLIDMGETNIARNLIVDETQKRQKELSTVVTLIKDPTIAGQIIGKNSRSQELNIELNLDSNSFISERIAKPDAIDLTTIIGNLIENAFDAFKNVRRNNKSINLLLKESDSNLYIKVTDNATGIEQENIDKIFDLYFSTKNEIRGHGLYIVKNIVDSNNGHISVVSNIYVGTEIEIILPILYL